MRRIMLLITALLVVLVGTDVKAQSTPSATCNLTTVAQEIATFKASGDNTKDIAALIKARNDIDQAVIACRGMSFSGTKNKILGPIDLPKGVFLITLKTTGLGGAIGNVLDGSCGNTENDPQAFLLAAFTNESNLRTQNFRSDGCKLTVEINAVSGPWSITFEPIE